MPDAWTRKRVQDEYDLLCTDYSAKSEQAIRHMATEAVDANAGLPHIGVEILAGGLYVFPVHAHRRGYRYIKVRLLSDMEREEALEIAEHQIREQWIEQPQETT